MSSRGLFVFAFLCTPTLLAQVGSEFRANSYTTGGQRLASVAASGNTFVVVWQSSGQDGSGYGIYAQRFTSASKPLPLGAEFLVNGAATAGSQTTPASAMDGSGNFVIVWQSAPSGSFTNVYGRRFDGSGAPLGSEFRVNTSATTASVLRRPSVASASDGSFVVAWTTYDGAYERIAAQRYSSAGAPLGGEFRVNTSTTGGQRNASVAFAGNGASFVIVWNDNHYGEGHVFGQRYDASGAKLGTEFRVNTHTTYPRHTYPSVAADSAGNFTVVWQSFRQISAPSNNDIFGQRYDSAGAPLGSEFLVNFTGTTSDQVRPRIASDTAGNLTVVWQSGAGNYSVVGQRFLSTGAPLGGEFPLSSSTPETTHSFPAAAASGAAFVVAWSAKYDGDGYGIFGKHYPGPGDVNGDGVTNVQDVFYLINFLFAQGSPPIGPADCNGDGSVTVTDVFYLINFLFAQGAFPK